MFSQWSALAERAIAASERIATALERIALALERSDPAWAKLHDVMTPKEETPHA
jgi:hypothetical protein